MAYGRSISWKVEERWGKISWQENKLKRWSEGERGRKNKET